MCEPEQYFNVADEYKCFYNQHQHSTLRLSSIFLGYPNHKHTVLLEAQVHQIEKEAFSVLHVKTPSPLPQSPSLSPADPSGIVLAEI